MKSFLIFIFSFTIFFLGQGVVNTLTAQGIIELTIVYDLSKSTDTFIMLNKKHLEQIYTGMGKRGGGKIYGLHIQTNSARQNPTMAEIAPLNLISLKGNPYQQGNIKSKNKALLAQYDLGKETVLANLARQLILPKTYDFSDIRNALELARKISENPTYATYTKKLLIISDLENDLPPVQGIDQMARVMFSSGVEIYLVRPSGKVDISKIMAGKYLEFVTVEDAIESMFN